MICLSLAEEKTEYLENILHQNASHADCAEIRLDFIDHLIRMDFSDFIKEAPLPLLFTNRPESEGGRFKGTDEERLSFLKKAAHDGAAYVDVEYRTPAEERDMFIRKAKKSNTKVIVSYHDFHSTPSEDFLLNLFKKMQETGADIVKIATMATKTDDILNISSLYRKEAKGSKPLIAFCMGEIGKISRLLSLSLGSYLVFTSSGPGKSTAPGQISLHDFKAMVALLQK